MTPGPIPRRERGGCRTTLGESETGGAEGRGTGSSDMVKLGKVLSSSGLIIVLAPWRLYKHTIPASFSSTWDGTSPFFLSIPLIHVAVKINLRSFRGSWDDHHVSGTRDKQHYWYVLHGQSSVTRYIVLISGLDTSHYKICKLFLNPH